jgi:hypothetical protein
MADPRRLASASSGAGPHGAGQCSKARYICSAVEILILRRQPSEFGIGAAQEAVGTFEKHRRGVGIFKRRALLAHTLGLERAVYPDRSFRQVSVPPNPRTWEPRSRQKVP